MTTTATYQRSLSSAANGSITPVSGKTHWLKPLAILCCMVNAVAAGAYGKFTYAEYPTGDVGDIDIPTSSNGKPVTIQRDKAFLRLPDLV